MWKSDDEESNLLESVVNWAAPILPPSSTTKLNKLSSSKVDHSPPLPPPSPFSDLFPQELLQSSGLLLSQFDDVDETTSDRRQEIDETIVSLDNNGQKGQQKGHQHSGVFFGTYRCAECKFSTDDRRLFMCHKRSKHAGEKTFLCPDCSAKFTRQYSLKKHVLQKHPSAVVAGATTSQLPKYCPFPNCKYATRNPNSMQLHKRTHQQLYFCKECNARYTRRQSLLGHLTKQHGSNAALIGMGPSPVVGNAIDEQSLQSPPPPSHQSSSTLSPNIIPSTSIVPFFQTNSCETKLVNNKDESSAATTFSLDENESSTIGVGDFNGVDASDDTIQAVVGSIAAAPVVDIVSDQKFFCDKCQFTANTLRRLYAHKLSSHRSAKEKMIAKSNHHLCPHCPKKFASLKRMLTHVKKVHTATIKKERKRKSGGGGAKKRQHSKKRASPSEMVCDRCDFTTSRKRIFAAHVKSHLTENVERVQDSKYDNQIRKPNPIINNRRFSPDRNLADAVSTPATNNSPAHASAVSPNNYDFYFNGAARYSGSGSSTHSNGSVQENAAIINNGHSSNFGQFLVVNRNRGPSSTNSFSSDNSTPANTTRSIRLDLHNQNTINGDFDDTAACLQGLQQSNAALLQMLRRRDNELRSLRTNVVELLRLLLPNHQAFQNCLSLDNVDDTVTNALSRVLTEAVSQK